MKVLVTGVTGQLGYDVAKELERRHIEYKGVRSGGSGESSDCVSSGCCHSLCCLYSRG